MTEEMPTPTASADPLREKKKPKPGDTTNALLIGLFIGVAVYSAARNGFGFGTLLPMLVIFLLLRNRRQSDAQTKEPGASSQD